MGLSRMFGCFRDPESRASQKKRKSEIRVQETGERQSHVGSSAIPASQNAIRMGSLPHQPMAPAVERAEPPKSTPEPAPTPAPVMQRQHTPERWSMGAVARRTSQVEEQLAQMKIQATQERDAQNKAIRDLQTEENNARMRTYLSSDMGYLPRDSWGEGPGIRAADLLRLPVKGVKPRIMTVEEEEQEKMREEEWKGVPPHLRRSMPPSVYI